MSKKGRLARRVRKKVRRQELEKRNRKKVAREYRRRNKDGDTYGGIESGPHKPLIPFKNSDKVLLIGEGDFSFALSAVEMKYIQPENLIATSFDTIEELNEKYPNVAKENITKLQNLHVTKIYHGVDCTNLIKTLKLSDNPKKLGKNKHVIGGLKIDLILFNFPHVGSGIKDHDRNIRVNQQLIVDYFKNGRKLYDLLRINRRAETGDKKKEHQKFTRDNFSTERIGLSMFLGEPYDSWEVKKLAKYAIGYQVARSGNFDWETFKGYHHRKTASMHDTTKVASERKARIFVFQSPNIPILLEKVMEEDRRDNSSDDDLDEMD